MSFFDAKEEVIEIQLTPEGKQLFFAGKFKPTQYQFFDDDITYDSTAAGISEAQNDSQTRIKSVPRVKITNIYGVDTEYRNKHPAVYYKVINGKPTISIDNVLLNPNKDLLKYPLGISDYTTQYSPAWNVINYKSQIFSSSKSYVVGSGNLNTVSNIPQANISASYLYKTPPNKAEYDPQYEFSFANNVSTLWDSMEYEEDKYKPFGANRVVIEQKNVPLFDVREENSILENDGFTIQIFDVQQKTIVTNLGTQTEEILKPLSFNELEPDPNNKVSTFFDVYTDQELLDLFGVPELNIFDPYSNPFKTKEAEPCE